MARSPYPTDWGSVVTTLRSVGVPRSGSFRTPLITVQRGRLPALPWYHSGTTEVTVANLLLRDLDETVLQRLKAAAKAHRRSLQAEIHDALAQASARSLAETRRLSARWLKRLEGRAHSDSVALIREDRER